MKKILERLNKSIKHLEILDKEFREENYPEKEIYLEISKEIDRLDKENQNNEFSEELYVGGKRRNGANMQGYGRQMILSDIIQYIINGRGYFYAIRSKENMERYVKIILNLMNQLMLFDALTTNISLREEVLRELKDEISDDFFKEDYTRILHDTLIKYGKPIGLPLNKKEISEEIKTDLGVTTDNQAIKKLEDYYDSLVPKPLGLWGELLVYLHFLRHRTGYILPLLLSQRLITGYHNDFIKPPDFLLLPFAEKLNLMGIEVGSGKDTQSGNFSTTTGIPTSTKVNADNPKRCCICGKWMLFCSLAIKRYSDFSYEIKDDSKPIKCLNDCELYKPGEIMAGKCPFAMHRGGNPKEHIMEMKGDKNKYHFHLNCVLKDSQSKDNISDSKIITYYPYIKGLEWLEKIKNYKRDYQIEIEQLRKELIDKEKELEKIKKI